MTTPFKNPINNFAPVFLMLVAMFLLGLGCNTSKPASDPLAGFHFSSLNNLHSDKVIMDDYQNYIQNLPQKKRQFVGTVHFFQDDTGRHAINIEIGINGTWWEHVLIYDKDDKRIEVIKYKNGGYSS